MNALEVIGRKRDGGEHTSEEIEFLLSGYLRKEIPDYQMAAWLMAVCIRGMTRAETLALTQAMVASGEVLDLSGIEGIKADKHLALFFRRVRPPEAVGQAYEAGSPV
jgi:pyrimidine-nucleoside phosphorylase